MAWIQASGGSQSPDADPKNPEADTSGSPSDSFSEKQHFQRLLNTGTWVLRQDPPEEAAVSSAVTLPKAVGIGSFARVPSGPRLLYLRFRI